MLITILSISIITNLIFIINWFRNRCEHDWEYFISEEGYAYSSNQKYYGFFYLYSKCKKCGSFNKERIDTQFYVNRENAEAARDEKVKVYKKIYNIKD